MDYYGDNEIQDREVLFEASAIEADDYAETNEGLSSHEAFDSIHSPESDEILEGAEELEGVDEVHRVDSLSTEDEQEHGEGDVHEEGGALHAQEDELDQENGAQMGTGTSDEVKVGPKRSKWLAAWLQEKEELSWGYRPEARFS